MYKFAYNTYKKTLYKNLSSSLLELYYYDKNTNLSYLEIFHLPPDKFEKNIRTMLSDGMLVLLAPKYIHNFRQGRYSALNVLDPTSSILFSVDIRNITV